MHLNKEVEGSRMSEETTPAAGDALENLLQENRRFAPTPEFAASAIAGEGLYAEAAADRPAFWARQARELLSWDKDFETALDWSNAPFAKWFVGGEVNAAYNALDRHVENGLGERVAIHFEGEPGDTRSYTYAQLTDEVKKAANAFESLGVGKG
ncbi:MAG: acetyl-coenzyme A synthetase, partial [Arthrobacter sp.]|nr:acetyl-coenzyme A synthetase [Arthrobacter sp.]